MSRRVKHRVNYYFLSHHAAVVMRASYEAARGSCRHALIFVLFIVKLIAVKNLEFYHLKGVRCVEMAGGASGMAEGDTVKQRVTVAGHALAESMKRMICRSTPSEELLAAIRELQSSVDAVVTTSDAIDLLRSMAQRGYL